MFVLFGKAKQAIKMIKSTMNQCGKLKFIGSREIDGTSTDGRIGNKQHKCCYPMDFDIVIGSMVLGRLFFLMYRNLLE